MLTKRTCFLMMAAGIIGLSSPAMAADGAAIQANGRIVAVGKDRSGASINHQRAPWHLRAHGAQVLHVFSGRRAVSRCDPRGRMAFPRVIGRMDVGVLLIGIEIQERHLPSKHHGPAQPKISKHREAVAPHLLGGQPVLFLMRITLLEVLPIKDLAEVVLGKSQGPAETKPVLL